MSTIYGIQCNGCPAHFSWTRERGEGNPGKSVMEQFARNQGWNAPDKIGNHWCPNCRRKDGRKRKT